MSDRVGVRVIMVRVSYVRALMISGCSCANTTRPFGSSDLG